MDKETCPIFSLSIVSVTGGLPIDGQNAMLHRNLREGGKNLGSTNKCTKFGQENH